LTCVGNIGKALLDFGILTFQIELD
jgi:hypothetical protein